MSIFGEEKSAASLGMKLNHHLKGPIDEIHKSLLLVIASKSAATQLVRCLEQPGRGYGNTAKVHYDLQKLVLELPEAIRRTKRAVEEMEKCLGELEKMGKICQDLGNKFRKARFLATQRERIEEASAAGVAMHLVQPMSINIQRCTAIQEHLQDLLQKYRTMFSSQPQMLPHSVFQNPNILPHFAEFANELGKIDEWYRISFNVLSEISKSVNKAALLETDILKHQMVGR